ncbi:MAG: tetratricopeptide repeat protein [Bacteroidota bacterium]
MSRVRALALLFGVGVCFQTPYGFAQTVLKDSLRIQLSHHLTQDTLRVALLQALATEVYHQDTTTAESLVREAESLAEKLSYQAGLARNYYIRGNLAITKSEYDKALQYYQEAETIFNNLGVVMGIAECTNAMGTVYYRQGDLELAKEAYERSLLLDQTLNNLSGVAITYNNLGNIAADKGEVSQAQTLYETAARLNDSLGNDYYLAKDLSNLGILFTQKGDFTTGLEYFLQALEIYEKPGNEMRSPRLYNNIGRLYQMVADAEQAEEYFQKGLAFSRRQGNRQTITLYLNALGNFYEEAEEYPQALIHYRQALDLSFEIQSLRFQIHSLMDVGDVFAAMETKDSAEHYFRRAILLVEQNPEFEVRASRLARISSTLLKLENYPLALEYAQRTQEAAMKSNQPVMLKSAASLLARSYENLGDFETAYIHLQRFKALSDSLLNVGKIMEIAEIEADFKYQRILDSASLREQLLVDRVQLADQNLAISEREKLLIVIGGLILALLLTFGIFRQRLKNLRTRTQNVMTEQKLLRTQMTPHFVFNSLTVLQGMILNKEDKKAVSYLSKFSRLLRVVLENSRERIVPLVNELVAIEHYVKVQNLGSQLPFEFTMEVEEGLDTHQLLVPPMMIQPFVENAIRYAYTPADDQRRIYVGLKFVDKRLEVLIEDDGIGIEAQVGKEKGENESLSTAITTERLQLLGRELRVQAGLSIRDLKHEGKRGTRVQLTLPYKQLAND